MFEFLNNFWMMVFACILLYIIVIKICNINKPFDAIKYIEHIAVSLTT